MADKVLMKGNEAIAEAAIKAGCMHYFGKKNAQGWRCIFTG